MKVRLCDACKKNHGKMISFVVGRNMDAAGSMSDDVVNIDLCKTCELLMLKRFIRTLPADLFEDFIRKEEGKIKES